MRWAREVNVSDLNAILDVALKIKDIVAKEPLADSEECPRGNTADIKVLRIAVKEARAKYNTIQRDYRSLGTKVFTLIATELAVITFIFAASTGTSDSGISAFARLLPSQLYGIIFFGVGIALVAVALGILLWCATRNKWAVPAETNVLKNLYLKDEKSFLCYLKDDYLDACGFCDSRYQKRRAAFDASILLFVMGAIILMIIKFGG